MALSLSLGEPSRFRFGPLFLFFFNDLTSNPAKTQKLDPNDVDGNIDGTQGRRIARDASVIRRVSLVGSHPNPPTKLLMKNGFLFPSWKKFGRPIQELYGIAVVECGDVFDDKQTNIAPLS